MLKESLKIPLPVYYSGTANYLPSLMLDEQQPYQQPMTQGYGTTNLYSRKVGNLVVPSQLIENERRTNRQENSLGKKYCSLH